MGYEQAIARVEEILGGGQKAVPTTPGAAPAQADFAAQLEQAGKVQASSTSGPLGIPQAAYLGKEPVQGGKLIESLFAPRRQAAQAIATRFGLKVTSDYRTPEHNAEVGGVPNSLHTRGLGFDLVGSPAQMEAARKWASGHPEIFQEVLTHDAGSGLHLHLGFKSS